MRCCHYAHVGEGCDNAFTLDASRTCRAPLAYPARLRAGPRVDTLGIAPVAMPERLRAALERLCVPGIVQPA